MKKLSSNNSKAAFMYKRFLVFTLLIALTNIHYSQTNPVVSSWLQNTTNIMGSHYVSGNSTAIADAVAANVQTVQYSASWVYVSTNGIPAYPTGPFLDGNPSLATDQNAIFRFPLVPTENTGTPTATTGGDIGVFINGVALFDYRDGVSYRASDGADHGGPIPGGPGDGIWNRDAVVAERSGFDCSKGHPAMGNYHHHQNPSAYDLDLNVISTICDLYAADGLYGIDSTTHSPLIGFAYDGFPIYGAYGYKNANGTGGITRIKSGYSLRNITVRTHYADGTNVTDGPAVSASFPLGHYREDYEFIANANEDYLDEHNGRFCITPEYPAGTYAYFCTVDENWNSAYPYAVGPTFYGNKVASKVASISESTTIYTSTVSIDENIEENLDIIVFPNPANDFIAIQFNGLVQSDIHMPLYDMNGRIVYNAEIKQGSTISYIDARTLYTGEYFLYIPNGGGTTIKKIVIKRN